MFKRFLLILLTLGATTSVVAHTYFFGITELSINPKSHKIEIIHQFTSHDVVNAITEQQQINFSPEHPKYEELIRDYFDQHFVLLKDNKELSLDWVGFEMQSGHIFVYQSSVNQNYLAGIVVKNDLLVDTYPKQVNTVNYQDTVVKGSLTFSQTLAIAKIMKNN